MNPIKRLFFWISYSSFSDSEAKEHLKQAMYHEMLNEWGRKARAKLHI